MGVNRLKIIGIGSLAMLILMLFRRKLYPNIKIWQILIINILLTITGVLGTMIMFYIESGSFGGTSFFGAVFFVPILMLPLMLLKIPYKQILNLCATAECLMLAVMRVDCFANGCCGGRYIPALKMVFPSQIVELIFALIVMVLLIMIENKNRDTHLYAHYLVLYGGTRYVLNWFRFGIVPFLFGLPQGNFWAVCAFIIGIIWLVLFSKKENKTKRVR